MEEADKQHGINNASVIFVRQEEDIALNDTKCSGIPASFPKLLNFSKKRTTYLFSLHLPAPNKSSEANSPPRITLYYVEACGFEAGMDSEALTTFGTFIWFIISVDGAEVPAQCERSNKALTTLLTFVRFLASMD
ncbi:hypothetical protein CEXT_799811 [Caerostris extrusa]|uniref:Uncharacterized protein n=1 Tax=Caerostris extrusa TaxID=172846 RepID=A0AAV4PWZ1_CAEEX|nr:hypothetical protein CEXT_799811 [Caerostris extrusa]